MATNIIYIPGAMPSVPLAYFESLPWETHTEARRELFMAYSRVEYTYGKGDFARTYRSIPFRKEISSEILASINLRLDRLTDVFYGSRQTWGPMNVCFLNRYDNQHQALGWHADDSPGMRHDRAIVVASFGEAREIWWREKGATGAVPPENRQLLANGSLFIMPPGFQLTHDHRIPKADREVGTRISLTFRSYEEPEDD